MQFPDNTMLLFERLGRRWQMTAKGMVLDFTQQQIQQMIFSWQQNIGLVQASDITIEGEIGVEVTIELADIAGEQNFTLYALSDQLLVYNQQKQLWLALPAAIAKQLLPS
jgi:nucleoside-specific outer membrane channel protein Tsx